MAFGKDEVVVGGVVGLVEAVTQMLGEQDRGQVRIAITRRGNAETSALIASLRERLPGCEFSYVNLESTL